MCAVGQIGRRDVNNVGSRQRTNNDTAREVHEADRGNLLCLPARGFYFVVDWGAFSVESLGH